MNNETEFNEGHIVEGLSYCHAVISLLTDLLVDHPAVIKAGCADELERAGEILADIYSKIGEQT